jgi:hypothetical protein
LSHRLQQISFLQGFIVGIGFMRAAKIQRH